MFSPGNMVVEIMNFQVIVIRIVAANIIECYCVSLTVSAFCVLSLMLTIAL